MLVIFTVKIVSFFVIFYPMNFPFFVQKAMGLLLRSSCSQVLLFLADMRKPKFLMQFRLSEHFAVLLCRVVLQRHSAHTFKHVELLEISPCRRVKPAWKEWGSHQLPYSFLQGPFSGYCLSQKAIWIHQLLQGRSYPLGLGARGRSFSVPAHCPEWTGGTRDFIFLYKEKMYLRSNGQNAQYSLTAVIIIFVQHSSS